MNFREVIFDFYNNEIERTFKENDPLDYKKKS
jgi:hypothetical protein